jgi:hypothetical protein
MKTMSMKKLSASVAMAAMILMMLPLAADAGTWRVRRSRHHHGHWAPRVRVGVYLPLVIPGPPVPTIYYGPAVPAVGAVDTDLSPEEAAIYVDGKYVGTADDFDGLPGYLLLPPGTYRIEAYLHGYEPLELEIEVRAGQRLRLTQELIPAREDYSYRSEAPPSYEPEGGSWEDVEAEGDAGMSDSRRPPYRNERFED